MVAEFTENNYKGNFFHEDFVLQRLKMWALPEAIIWYFGTFNGIFFKWISMFSKSDPNSTTYSN